MRTEKGLTLIEVMMILILFSVIMVIAYPSFKTTAKTVERLGIETDMARIEESIKLFHLDMRRQPQTLEELWQRPADDRLWRGPYLNPKHLVWPPENYTLDQRGKVYYLHTSSHPD